MRSDPETALQASEIVPAQSFPESAPELSLGLGQIKRHHPPFSIPWRVPQPRRVYPAERQKTPSLGQLHHATHRCPAAFQTSLCLQPPHSIQQPTPPSPALKRLIHRTKCRPRHHPHPPKQRIKKKFRPRFHPHNKTTPSHIPQSFWPIGHFFAGIETRPCVGKSATFLADRSKKLRAEGYGAAGRVVSSLERESARAAGRPLMRSWKPVPRLYFLPLRSQITVSSWPW